MKTHVRSRWQGAVLVCRKCSKRLGGGFGPKRKQSLAKMLGKELDGGRKRKASLGVIEVGCLGVCPRGGVTVVDGANPGRWLIVPQGASAQEVLAALGRQEDVG